ncbi:MAG: hypothetical protein R2838_15920 [Caldilineaceae bacterium]
MTAGKADWVAPWGEWTGVDTVDRYIDIAQRQPPRRRPGALAVNPGAAADVTAFPVAAVARGGRLRQPALTSWPAPGPRRRT